MLRHLLGYNFLKAATYQGYPAALLEVTALVRKTKRKVHPDAIIRPRKQDFPSGIGTEKVAYEGVETPNHSAAPEELKSAYPF